VMAELVAKLSEKLEPKPAQQEKAAEGKPNGGCHWSTPTSAVAAPANFRIVAS
jgi:hypothetical protein